jgi:hypothetical protein
MGASHLINGLYPSYLWNIHLFLYMGVSQNRGGPPVIIHGDWETPMTGIGNKHGAVDSGKFTKNYGKSPFFMGKLTKSMAIFKAILT